MAIRRLPPKCCLRIQTRHRLHLLVYASTQSWLGAQVGYTLGVSPLEKNSSTRTTQHAERVGLKAKKGDASCSCGPLSNMKPGSGGGAKKLQAALVRRLYPRTRGRRT